jgi:hypothetical protein
MSMRLSVVVMGLCVAMSVSLAHADVYKWKDADGRVHYGDQPKGDAEKLGGATVNGEAAPADTKDADDQQKKRAEECSRKRDQLTTYQKASKIVEKDALGNEKVYSDDERKKLVDQTQKQVTDGCADIPATNP